MQIFVFLALTLSVLSKKHKKQVMHLTPVRELRSGRAHSGGHHSHASRAHHHQTAHLHQRPDLQTLWLSLQPRVPHQHLQAHSRDSVHPVGQPKGNQSQKKMIYHRKQYIYCITITTTAKRHYRPLKYPVMIPS